LRDRGSKKWQSSFSIPEHVKMLKDLRNDYYKSPHPELDEIQIHFIRKDEFSLFGNK
jgi:hypothetical protein